MAPLSAESWPSCQSALAGGEFLGSYEMVLTMAAFLDFDVVAALSAASRSSEAPARAAIRGRSPEIYVCGGLRGGLHALASAERFLLGEGRWEALPAMSTPRFGAVAAAIRGHLYICGGSSSGCSDLIVNHGEAEAESGAGLSDGCNLSSAERFCPAEGRWEALPDMLERRRGASGAALGGLLYVCGGEGGGDGEFVLSSAERFDPVLWRWEPLAPMACHRFAAAAAAMEGRLCIVGGSLGVDALGSVEQYCPERGLWEELPALLEPRAGAAVLALPGPRGAGHCLLACGGGRADRVLMSAELLRPGAAHWEEAAAPGVPGLGFRFAACTHAGGSLLVCGGQLGIASGSRAARRLDTERGCWEDLPPMGTARAMAAAARLLC